MKLQRLQDVRISAADAVFRESLLNKALPVAVFLAAAIGLSIGASVTREAAARWVLGAMAGFMLLFAWIFFSLFRKTLGPANWLVRLASSGDVAVKYRSYANAHFPAEDIVAFTLHPSEIKWVRATRDRVITIDGHHDTTSVRRQYLDLAVDEAIAKQVAEQIQIERRRGAPQTGTIIKSRAKTLDYPVSVVDDHIIRIEWRGKSAWITPKLATAVELLIRHVKLEPEADEGVKDYTAAPHDNAAAKILALAKTGDEFGAIALARKAYDCSLAEAKRLVDQLVGKCDDKGTTD